MNSGIKDILGNPLAVGDEIVVAFPDGGSSAELRIGAILQIIEKPTERWNRDLKTYFPGPPTYTLEVKWDKDKSPSFTPEKSKMSKPAGRIMKLK
jgi:hypothetical protein